MARSRLPLRVSGSGRASSRLAWSRVSQFPARGPSVRAPRDLRNPGGELGQQQTVVGGFGGQLLNGRQLDIDRRGGQAAALELGPVALHGCLGEARAFPGSTPRKKTGQDAVVGAAGMRGAHAVEDQTFDCRERLGQLRPGNHTVLWNEPQQSSYGGIPKLQLHRSAGMLFVPERDQRRFEPAAHRAQPVDASMAGGTQGDQEARVVDARPAVVDGQFTIGPTGAAAPSVTLQNLLAVAGEAAAGMPFLPVTARAQSAAKEPRGSRRGKKPGLPDGAPRRWRRQSTAAGPAGLSTAWDKHGL